MVPLPDRVPVVVKPAVRLKVAPEATLIVPDWVKLDESIASVPAYALIVPVLTNGEVMLCDVAYVLLSVPALLNVPAVPVIMGA